MPHNRVEEGRDVIQPETVLERCERNDTFSTSSMDSEKAPPKSVVTRHRPSLKMERRKGSRGRGLERGIPLSLVEILTEHIGESFEVKFSRSKPPCSPL